MKGKTTTSYEQGTFGDLDDGRITFRPSERLRIEVRDPVCGTGLLAAGPSAAYNGVSYYFCSEECRRAFVSDPGRYVR